MEITTPVENGAVLAPEEASKKRKPFSRGARVPRRDEFEQVVLNIRRVTRVVAGGRRFSFSAAVVVGDRKGRVGIGVGKGVDTALAIQKAVRLAKRNLITIPLTKSHSIKRAEEAKYCASRVIVRPVPGRGLVAGSVVRSVLDVAGVRDVSAKIVSRSKNKINNARAVYEALRMLGEHEALVRE